MKIKEILIKNFRSVKEEKIIFPENWILALVWPNNAWKSNVLKAINNILWDTRFNWERAELNDFYNKKKENTIEIKISFDDGKYVEFKSNDSWAKYYDETWHQIYSTQWSVKDDFPCTYLSANRDLEKNLQFRSYELMWKIAKAFNERIWQETKEKLETKFWDIMSEFDNIEWFTDFKSDFSSYYDDLQSDSQYKIKVSFKAFSPLNYFKTINLLANDTSIDDNYNIDPVELWEWDKSLILFALIRSYAKNFKQVASWILAIEEPEIYLHPQARRHLYQVFNEIVSTSNIQIIYTTHSPDFLSTEEFSSIWLVSKDPNEWTKVKIVTEQNLVNFCIQTWVPEAKTNIWNIKEFYSTTSDFRLNEWFFAKHLILVEWDTEEMCLPLLFERLWLNYYSSWISVIWVEGKNQIPKYWRLFKSFNIPISVVIDSDKDWSDSRNIANCFWCSENDIISDIDIIKKIETEKQKLYIFEKDFETALRKSFSNDSKFEEYESEAKNIIKPISNTSQKWQIARFICKRILENHEYMPEFLQELYNDIQLSQSSIPVEHGDIRLNSIESNELPF